MLPATVPGKVQDVGPRHQRVCEVGVIGRNNSRIDYVPGTRRFYLSFYLSVFKVGLYSVCADGIGGDVDDSNLHLLNKLKHFIEHHKDLEKDKFVKIREFGNKEKSKQIILEAMKNHEKYKNSLR